MHKNHPKPDRPRTLPLPSVNGAIFNEKKEILLTRRSAGVREPGKWCLPGGHLEIGETWITGLRRELKEEVGIEVVEEELTGIYSDPSLTTTVEVLSDGFYHQFVTAVFLIREYRGEVVPNWEVDAWDWFAPGKLPVPIFKSHPVRVEDAFAYRGEAFVR